MLRFRTLNALSPVILDRLDGVLIGPDVDDPDAIVVRSADMHRMDIPDSVLAVGRAGVGVNNIPVPSLGQRGIAVFNAPGANANAVKELVIAGMLLGARRLARAWDFVRGLDGAAALRAEVEAGKHRFVGTEIGGRTLGVIGLGAIGSEVATAALGLGMRVVGYDPRPEAGATVSSSVHRVGTIEEAFRNTDVLTVHVPLDDTTRGLVSAERLALLADGAILLDFAREEIVDERAVLAALDAGRLGAFVTDFPTPLLKDHPAVTALPHLGASTGESEANAAAMVIESLRAYLVTGVVRHSVNLPDTDLPHWEGERLAVINRNVPGVVGGLSAVLGSADRNIIDMVNGSRGDLAHTLVDVDGHLDRRTLAALAGVDGVIRVRVVGGQG